MTIFLYILFIILGGALGILSTYIYFTSRSFKKLKSKYEKLEQTKTPINMEIFDDLNIEYDKKVKENDILKSNITKLKSYLGIAREHEYGIYKSNYQRGDKKFRVEAEIKTIKRGKEKVKIEVNGDIKTSPVQKQDKSNLSSIRSLIDGWYDIDDEDITWVVPDEAMRREFDIDQILHN
tara:strand:+ start:163621 stop:164157 length:537 start_codon:yes stop_codon:yes gene_type:complete